MQQINFATVKAAKASNRKALAILAYDNATAEPEGANWRAVADMLRLAIPATKAKAAEIAADSRFAPWEDHSIPVHGGAKKLGKSPVIVVMFEGGEIVRCPAVTLPGKPVNIGRGLRIAFAFYQCRMAGRFGGNSDWSRCIKIPAIVSVVCETSGTEYDAADCNAKTAELRAGSFDAEEIKAESLNYPETTDDGTLDRFDFQKASYRLAVSRLRLSEMPEGADTRELTYQIEEFTLRIAGQTMLQIKAKWRDDDNAARKAATAQAPVAPSFKIPRRFLTSTYLTLVHSRPPVAPSAKIQRVA